jgi:hypothetical protein
MPKFRDIPQFTRNATYAVDVSWQYLPTFYVNHVTEYGLNVSPDFQRGYVWTLSQKVRFIEYILRGGATGKNIYCNSPSWNTLTDMKDYVLVDGKQRLDAVLGFLSNEFPIFGENYCRDYEDTPSMLRSSFRWHVNDLQTRDEVLTWYCDLNSGGTIHSEEELDRVRALKGQPTEIITSEQILESANLNRGPLKVAYMKALEEKSEMEAARTLQASLPQSPSKVKRGKGKHGVR